MPEVLIVRETGLLTVFLLAIGLFLSTYSQAGDLNFDKTSRKLEQAQVYFRDGQFKKARQLLDVLKYKVFETSDCHGLEYPTSITLNIRYLDNLLKDKEGLFERFPSYSGIIEDCYIGHTGYFKVKGKDGVRYFAYGRDVLMKGGLPGVGKRVTVYFKEDTLTDHIEVKKIVVSQ